MAGRRKPIGAPSECSEMSTDGIRLRGEAAHTKANTKSANRVAAAAVMRTLDTAAAKRKMTHLIKQELWRCEGLQRRMDAALGDTLFLSNEDPLSPRNLQRFKKYFRMLTLLNQLKLKLIHEFMRVHVVNPSNQNHMWKTTAPVGEFFAQISDIQPTTSKQSIQAVSEEVQRLAAYLTRHAHATRFNVESYETATDREKRRARRTSYSKR